MHVHRVETELVGHEVADVPDHVRRLGSSCAAVSFCRHLVRVDACEVHTHDLELVAAAMNKSRQRRNRGCEQLYTLTESLFFAAILPSSIHEIPSAKLSEALYA
jgi:hypothetical protein